MKAVASLMILGAGLLAAPLAAQESLCNPCFDPPATLQPAVSPLRPIDDIEPQTEWSQPRPLTLSVGDAMRLMLEHRDTADTTDTADTADAADATDATGASEAVDDANAPASPASKAVNGPSGSDHAESTGD